MRGTERKNVVLFPTCLADLMFPDATAAARRVLERGGCDVESRPGAVCCGQPGWNSGHVEEARRVASGALHALEGDEPIVLCSGSCTTMMHEYWPQLFEGTEDEDAARDVAGRVHEFSSFVHDQLPPDATTTRSETGAVSYHDSCHMLRTLGISEAPRALLARVQGLELRELDACDRCCGFGGTFSLRYPELSAAMADEKVDDAKSRGVDTIVASDFGCLMQICGRAAARGVELNGKYIAEILDEGAGGGR